jgi:hypothetical protein
MITIRLRQKWLFSSSGQKEVDSFVKPIQSYTPGAGHADFMNEGDIGIHQMNHGLWIWPSDQKEQRHVVDRVSRSAYLMTALKAIAKSQEGLSNAELDDILSDNSNWMTLWVIRQLMALGFINYNVAFFGNAAKYTLTDLGKNVLQALTGQPAAAKPVAPAAQPAQQTPKPAPPTPTSSPPRA